MNNKILPVVELYTAVQSEGSRAGYPTIVVRTSGCPLRCAFGDGGFCDTWYTSWHPEKGKYTFEDIIDIYDKNPHIKEMMITGGSPTMHPNVLQELTAFATKRGIFTTMETEGSKFVKTTHPIDLISLSPKFSNSVPKVGSKTPLGKEVVQSMVDQHNKNRMNYSEMAQSIMYHRNFHIKPVVDKDLSNVGEIEEFIQKLAEELVKLHYGASGWTSPLDLEDLVALLKRKTWLMPAGDTRQAIQLSYGPVMNYCRDTGYKFTGRPHIVAFDQERCV